jgi:hypothetical protein
MVAAKKLPDKDRFLASPLHIKSDHALDEKLLGEE